MIITPELCAKLVICVSLLGDGGSAKGIRKGNPLRGGSPGRLFSENLSHRVHGKPCRQIQTLGQGITSLSTFFIYAMCVGRPDDFPGGTSGKEYICQCRRYETQVPGKIPWRKKWQPITVFLRGEFHGQRSLGGYSP